MAKPVHFPQANLVLKAPPSMGPEDCGDLHVFNRGKHSISCWELDAAELAEVMATGRVWLYVWSGDSQPPVAVSVASPFR